MVVITDDASKRLNRADGTRSAGMDAENDRFQRLTARVGEDSRSPTCGNYFRFPPSARRQQRFTADMMRNMQQLLSERERIMHGLTISRIAGRPEQGRRAGDAQCVESVLIIYSIR